MQKLSTIEAPWNMAVFCFDSTALPKFHFNLHSLQFFGWWSIRGMGNNTNPSVVLIMNTLWNFLSRNSKPFFNWKKNQFSIFFWLAVFHSCTFDEKSETNGFIASGLIFLFLSDFCIHLFSCIMIYPST